MVMSCRWLCSSNISGDVDLSLGGTCSNAGGICSNAGGTCSNAGGT